MLCGGALALTACPYISEVHADSDPLPDNEGEFVELVIPSNAHQTDSVHISLNSKTLVISSIKPGERQVFCHQDSIFLRPNFPVQCKPLLSSLPNAEELRLILQSGTCNDTTWITRSVSGKSWQLDSNFSWQLSQPSPGFGLPEFEANISNFHPHFLHRELTDSGWNLHFTAKGTEDMFSWTMQWIPLGDSVGEIQNGQGFVEEEFIAIQPRNQLPWARVQLSIEGDAFPLDNQIELLLFPRNSPPIRISEVAPDPPNHWPEWIEFVNQSPIPLPLWSISSCNPMNPTDSTVLMYPGTHALITDSKKDLIDAAPSLSHSHVLETAKSWSLVNYADTVRLCMWGQQVDSLFWNKDKHISTKHSSPGWQPPSQASNSTPKLSTRIISFSKSPSELRIEFPPGDIVWTLDIWDRNGNRIQKSTQINTRSYKWKPGRHIRPGPYRISLLPSKGSPFYKGVLLAP